MPGVQLENCTACERLADCWIISGCLEGHVYCECICTGCSQWYLSRMLAFICPLCDIFDSEKRELIADWLLVSSSGSVQASW